MGVPFLEGSTRLPSSHGVAASLSSFWRLRWALRDSEAVWVSLTARPLPFFGRLRDPIRLRPPLLYAETAARTLSYQLRISRFNGILSHSSRPYQASSSLAKFSPVSVGPAGLGSRQDLCADVRRQCSIAVLLRGGAAARDRRRLGASRREARPEQSSPPRPRARPPPRAAARRGAN